jgi:hypothetical protein
VLGIARDAPRADLADRESTVGGQATVNSARSVVTQDRRIIHAVYVISGKNQRILGAASLQQMKFW